VVQIVLTEKAASDLEAIDEYYSRLQGTEASRLLVTSMFKSLRRLANFPGSGRPSQVPGVRELVFQQAPYIAPYLVRGQQVQVLRILHQRNERAHFM
jgi:toxin ParE1/3/4